MKRSLYILTPVLAVSMTACTAADDGRDGATGAASGDAISYTVSTSQTRTVISGTTFPTDKTFRVWAYEENVAEPLINGDVVRLTSGSVWSTEEKYYWPQGAKVSFYALYPVTAAFDAATKTVACTLPTAVSSQEDLLYETVTAAKLDAAVAKNSVKKYAVPLTFHHALAQVAFKGKVSGDNKDWSIDVAGISICNAMSSATFSLETKAWSASATPATFPLGIRSDAGTLTYYEADGTTEAAAKDLTAADGALLMIPQTLTAWDKTTAVTATTGAYLAVTCHIRVADNDVFGTAETPLTTYVPFDNAATPWESGRKYTYTLQFGAGTTADGKPLLQVLVVSSEITDWTDGTGGDIDAKMTTE